MVPEEHKTQHHKRHLLTEVSESLFVPLSGNDKRPGSRGFKKLSEFGNSSLQGHKRGGWSVTDLCWLVEPSISGSFVSGCRTTGVEFNGGSRRNRRSRHGCLIVLYFLGKAKGGSGAVQNRQKRQNCQNSHEGYPTLNLTPPFPTPWLPFWLLECPPPNSIIELRVLSATFIFSKHSRVLDAKSRLTSANLS